MNRKRYLIIGAVLLYIVEFPIVVNNLMAFKIGTVYGETATWITFLAQEVVNKLYKNHLKN
ncbi:hypothetical protein [Jeotgalibacillus malaysiensis]|uniref:hypothetical protein n=1 Tax=Jeotgalibacillus malaysiensis TaxID=1508404 RepID=UPI003850B630